MNPQFVFIYQIRSQKNIIIFFIDSFNSYISKFKYIIIIEIEGEILGLIFSFLFFFV